LRWIAADCHRVCLGIEEGPQLSEQQIADRGFKFKVGHHFLSCLVEKPVIHRQWPNPARAVTLKADLPRRIRSRQPYPLADRESPESAGADRR
jgi:hypothetical protein